MCALTPYRIPNFRIDAHDVVLNKLKAAAYRAPGAPMGALAVECVLDEIAESLRIDPIELRMRNAVEAGDVTPVGGTIDSIGLKEALQAAREAESAASGSGSGGSEFAAGGFVSGPGTATSDSIPAWLSDGEFVLKNRAVKRYGVRFLRALNAMRIASPAGCDPAV